MSEELKIEIGQTEEKYIKEYIYDYKTVDCYIIGNKKFRNKEDAERHLNWLKIQEGEKFLQSLPTTEIMGNTFYLIKTEKIWEKFKEIKNTTKEITFDFPFFVSYYYCDVYDGPATDEWNFITQEDVKRLQELLHVE